MKTPTSTSRASSAEAKQFAIDWLPDRQPAIYEKLNTILAGGPRPMVELRDYFGTALLTNVITAHIATALRRCGSGRNISAADIESMASTIVSSRRPETALLSIASVVTFFYRLGCADIEIDYFTPYNILRAFNIYASEARRHEIRIARENRPRQEAAATERPVTWEEYAAMKGITAPNPVEYVRSMFAAERAAKEAEAAAAQIGTVRLDPFARLGLKPIVRSGAK